LRHEHGVRAREDEERAGDEHVLGDVRAELAALEVVADHLQQETQHTVRKREREEHLPAETQVLANPEEEREKRGAHERLVNLRGVDRQGRERLVIDQVVLHVLHPGRRARPVRQRPFGPVRERARLLQPFGRAERKRFTEVAAEEVTADPRQHEARREARRRDVGPRPERHLLPPQIDDGAEEPAEKSAVRHEPAAPQGEDLPERLELARVRHVVEHA
jgi:hypothetical protein